MSQVEMLTLFGNEYEPGHELTMSEKFVVFHLNNPRVFKELEAMTEQMMARGRSRIGIAMLFEVLRWNFYMGTNDPNSEFKLNNNYRSFYARLLMDLHPEWGQVFELRELQGRS
jgi:hypothetical protein